MDNGLKRIEQAMRDYFGAVGTVTRPGVNRNSIGYWAPRPRQKS